MKWVPSVLMCNVTQGYIYSSMGIPADTEKALLTFRMCGTSPLALQTMCAVLVNIVRQSNLWWRDVVYRHLHPKHDDYVYPEK